MKYNRIIRLLSFFIWVFMLGSCFKGMVKKNGHITAADTGKPSNVPFRNMLGINGFEWDYRPDGGSGLDSEKIGLIRTFTAFRQYLDWDNIEEKEGKYRFSYDDMYETNKVLHILTLPCIQIIPKWFRKKYYPNQYDANDPYGSLREYIPVAKGADKTNPASYMQMAKLGFQIAGRYGVNKNIPDGLVHAVTWGDKDDSKIGLGLLEYIECGNEPDKFWSGPDAEQTPEEYAAELSAFYDGHLGTMGKDVGVKTADPNMKVVMAGIVGRDEAYVDKMVAWCKKNRRKNGVYSLCFDVINYHDYASARTDDYWKNDSDLEKNHGIAPELGDAARKARYYVTLQSGLKQRPEIWVTETGYDVNDKSIQRAIKINHQSTEETQADWNLRTALLYARNGIDRVFFYMLNDVDVNSAAQYSSSGFLANKKRRETADFFLQANDLMGDFIYNKTINKSPLVDVYKKGNEQIYVLTMPSQTARQMTYSLNLRGSVKEAVLYHLQPGSKQMKLQKLQINDHQLDLLVTERPVFLKITH